MGFADSVTVEVNQSGPAICWYASVDSGDLTDSPRWDCEDPPFFSTHGSNISTTATNSANNVQRSGRVNGGEVPGTSSVGPRRTELRRMDEVIERLWDPSDSTRVYASNGGRIQNPYRPSISQNLNLTGQGFTATWGGELRIRNEVLVDENAFAKEQTLRDLETFNAIEQRQAQQQNRRDGREEGSCVASCSADMRDYQLDENDPRIPSFLRKRDPVPLKRMQVPGMMVERETSVVSSTDDNGFGFLGMDFSTIRDLSGAQSGPPSLSSCSEFSLTEKGRHHQSLTQFIMSKCARRVTSWKRQNKHFNNREIPSIREDNEPMPSESSSETGHTNTIKGSCFLCLGGAQATKYSVEEPNYPVEPTQELKERKPSELKSVLLTTSPLYGDMVPSSATKAPINDLAFSTQQSLNIAATRNPTNDLSSDDENEDVIAIWDESDAESDQEDVAFNISGRVSAAGLPDCPSARSWEPPVLKTDQEYEMYLLQSRIESVHSAKHRLDCLSTTSLSSWDCTTARDLSRLEHQSRSRRQTGSDFGHQGEQSGKLGSENGCHSNSLSFGSKASC